MKRKLQSYTALLVLFGISFTLVPANFAKAEDKLKLRADFSYSKPDLSQITWEYSTPLPTQSGYQDQVAIFHYNSEIKSDEIGWETNGSPRKKPTTTVTYKTYSTAELQVSVTNRFFRGRNYDGYTMLIVSENKVMGVIAKVWRSSTHTPVPGEIQYEILPAADIDNRSYYNAQGEDRRAVSTLSLINNYPGAYSIKTMGNPETQEGLCQNIDSRWTELKKLIKSLYLPAPGGTPPSMNAKWIVYDTGATHLANNITADIRKKLDVLANLVGFGNAKLMLNLDNLLEVDVLDLSEQGVITFKNMGNKAVELKADIEALKKNTTASDKDSIKASCPSLEIKPVKNSEALEKLQPNLEKFSDLVENITKATAVANSYVDIVDKPDLSPGICGSAVNISDAILVGMCNITHMFRTWAMSLLCFAQTKLGEVLGQYSITSGSCFNKEYETDPTMTEVTK